VEPERHLAFAERIRLALSEPQLALGDRLIAATALGSAARCRFDDVCHGEIIKCDYAARLLGLAATA
jgi:hypothetical protein